MWDDSPEHVLAEMARAARAAAGERSILLVAESETQEARIVRPPERGGYGFDAIWNDDFHHSVRVALTGVREAFFRDYDGTARELAATVKRGFLYQGQRREVRDRPRGSPALDLHPARLVTYIENHDQIANSAPGLRLASLTSPSRLRAMAALLLLGPGTPMLFQGQERGATSPFFFFADHHEALAAHVRAGRTEYVSRFPSAGGAHDVLADPGAADTFERSRVSGETAHARELHRDLIALRREQPRTFDVATLSQHALVVRAFGPPDRLLVVNLAHELVFVPASEPLLAPPEDASWKLRFSSDDPRYGGNGAHEIERDGAWTIPAECATLLVAGARTQ
jgi:maltooligosyltrehalose trehalohydrolase